MVAMACNRWTSILFSPGLEAVFRAPASSFRVSSTLGSCPGSGMEVST